MKKSEKILFGIAFGAVIPVTLFYLGLGISREPGFEKTTYVFPAAGFIIGIVFVILLRKKLFSNIYNIHEFLLYIIYIFYSILLFSVYTYVPVFNLLLSFPTGYYVAKKCFYFQPEDEIPYDVFSQYARFSAYIFSAFVVISFFVVLGKMEAVPEYANYLVEDRVNKTGAFIYRISLYLSGFLIFLQYYLTKNIAINIFQNLEIKEKTGRNF